MLAHSLSGAAIQLQGARKLAEREQASPQVRAAIERAGELVRDGLTSARQAVGALRGEELPGVAQLESLVASFRERHEHGRDADDRGQHAPAPGRREPRALPRRPGGAHQHRPLRTRRHDHRRAPLRQRTHLAHRRGSPGDAAAKRRRPRRRRRRERAERAARAARARRRHACRPARPRPAGASSWSVPA